MWSKEYDKCVVCGSDETKHMSKGMCRACYLKQYRNDPKNVNRIKEQKHAWYVKSGGKHYAKISREELHFDGKREKILQRDGHACVKCGATPAPSKLTVHHIDGNGRGSDNPNNDDDNLMTLCRSCHAAEHGKIETWSKEFDFCVGCGTDQIPHNAKGYCRLCYARIFRKRKI